MEIQKGDIIRLSRPPHGYEKEYPKGAVSEVKDIYKQCAVLNRGVLIQLEAVKFVARPEPEPFIPEEGKWYKFWDDDPEDFCIQRFANYDEGHFCPYDTHNNSYKNCAPITEEDIKIIANG